MNARKAVAIQKRDASAQSEGEEMEDGEAEPKRACQLWLLMELVRELQSPTQKATATQETYNRETEEEQPQKRIFFKVEISDFYFKNATSPFFFLRFVKKRLSSTMFLLLFPCSFSRGVHDYSSTF